MRSSIQIRATLGISLHASLNLEIGPGVIDREGEREREREREREGEREKEREKEGERERRSGIIRLPWQYPQRIDLSYQRWKITSANNSRLSSTSARRGTMEHRAYPSAFPAAFFHPVSQRGVAVARGLPRDRMTIWAVIHEPRCWIESRSNRIERRLISAAFRGYAYRSSRSGTPRLLRLAFRNYIPGFPGEKSRYGPRRANDDKRGRSAQRYCPAVLRSLVSLFSFSDKSDSLRRGRGFSLARINEESLVGTQQASVT